MLIFLSLSVSCFLPFRLNSIFKYFCYVRENPNRYVIEMEMVKIVFSTGSSITKLFQTLAAPSIRITQFHFQMNFICLFVTGISFYIISFIQHSNTKVWSNIEWTDFQISSFITGNSFNLGFRIYCWKMCLLNRLVFRVHLLKSLIQYYIFFLLFKQRFELCSHLRIEINSSWF